MASSNESTYGTSSNALPGMQNRGSCFGGMTGNANWSGSNIAAMVLGFIFFWPVGLVILYWIIKGRRVQELPGAIRDLWSRTFGNGKMGRSFDSGNAVFNAYQQTQHDRIQEIRDEIRARADRFNEFRDEAKRRADEEEFNRFMASAPNRADI